MRKPSAISTRRRRRRRRSRPWITHSSLQRNRHSISAPTRPLSLQDAVTTLAHAPPSPPTRPTRPRPRVQRQYPLRPTARAMPPPTPRPAASSPAGLYSASDRTPMCQLQRPTTLELLFYGHFLIGTSALQLPQRRPAAWALPAADAPLGHASIHDRRDAELARHDGTAAEWHDLSATPLSISYRASACEGQGVAGESAAMSEPRQRRSVLAGPPKNG